MSIVCVTDKLFCNRKSFVWQIEKLFWKKKKNHDENENFRVTIKFGAYTFLHWYLKKKNCKHKYHDVEVKSLKRWLTLGLLLKPGPGPPKKLDPAKHGSGETWNKYGIKKHLCL